MQGTSYYTIDVLKASLRNFGWREDDTLEVDARWADGDPSRLARLAQELVQLRPDVIATTGDSETKALQLATQDIPIVFHLVADPVANPVGQTT
jgi:putative tryptophan/tyrosine transport system substrate-binding protein